MKFTALIFFSFISLALYAVDYDLLIDIDTDNIEVADKEVEDAKEELSYLLKNPINLNSATRNQLEAIPFLNVIQVENLLEYIFDYGYMQSVYELSLINGFDAQTIKLLLPFIVVKPVEKDHNYSFKNIFKYGKSQLTIKSGAILQRKKGYDNGKYLGYPYSLSVKYSFKHSDFSLSLLGSKSEGEPLDFIYNKGFDFYSGHIAFKNLTKTFKSIILGDYRVVFGQGLVFKSKSSFNNYSFGSNIIYSDAINPSFSNSETGYLRGLAVSLGGKKYSLNIFTSHTDYNKNEGYHRTESDFEKRYQTTSYLLGGNFSFFGKYFKFGVSGYYDFYDKWFNVGFDYRFKIKRFNFTGEFAIDPNLNFGTINSLAILCSDKVSFNTSFRYYGKDFKSKLGNGYSRNNMTDEIGLYTAFDLSLFRNWKFNIYSDLFSTNKPSFGFNFGLKALYSPYDNNNGYFKYSVTSKPDYLGKVNGIKKYGTYYKNNFTLNYSYRVDNIFNINATLAANAYTKNNNISITSTFGYLLCFSGGWYEKRGILYLCAGASFFDIPIYDNVIYNYEPTILYGYSSNQYYGLGCRFFILIKVNPYKNMTINLKVGDTWFQDRDVIGSGNEEIKGSHKTDIQAIFNFKF